MAYFRKKPVVIEAVLIDHLISDAKDNWKGLPQWVRDSYETGGIIFTPENIHVRTLEGQMTGAREDFLIKGVQGELYPCKRDIFFATYEQVDEPVKESV